MKTWNGHVVWCHLLLSLLAQCWGVASVRIGDDSGEGGIADRRHALKEGDTFDCETKKGLTLQRKLGEGSWGAVFSTTDGAYAVKVETSTAWKARDPEHKSKDYAHECGIMRMLQRVPRLSVPDCHALCEVGGMDVFVMDFLAGAVDMHYVKDLNFADSQMRVLGRSMYDGVMAMLQQGVNNVDQRAVNILTNASATAWFIDQGMASTDEEFVNSCQDNPQKYEIPRKYRDAFEDGLNKTCQWHLESIRSLTMSAVLNSLLNARSALEGIADAYCASHPKQMQTNLFSVEVGEQDVRFKKFLKDTGMFGLQNGHWVKISDDPIGAVTSYAGSPKAASVPEGARLVAIADGVPGSKYISYDELSGWKPNENYNTLKPRTYVFAKPCDFVLRNVQYALRYHKDLVDSVTSCS